MAQLKDIAFQNEFVSTFPGDDSGDLSPRQTPGVLYSKAVPTPVEEPQLLAWTEDLAGEMGLDHPGKEDVDILAGNKVTSSMKPYAACYSGHQFGNWAGQLGDGRAISLGELQQEGKLWELQLKGAGPTAYSRHADGRAVLRSSVREYLMSEAMHHLGVPTTRALSLVSTGEKILRDMFYNGNAAYEPGAVVCRVSPSFLRFGNFEGLAVRKEVENLKNLVDWTIENHYPHITGENKILDWFKEVVDRTAALMVEWHRVGFVHGVMNTDNMSILGQTIDYGPYSFLDDYDPSFTPNTTDLPGRRYAFGNQPSIGYWNLSKLASALLPLFDDSEGLEEVLHTYEEAFWSRYYLMMGNKLGLDEVREEDKKLISNFEEVLPQIKPDMTIFYRLLIDMPLNASEGDEQLLKHFEDSFYAEAEEPSKTAFLDLLKRYASRRNQNNITAEASRELMKKTSPHFVLRNYLLHQAIEGLENGDDSLFEKLRDALKEPYNDNNPEFFKKRPEWASKKAGCSMLSCSS
ncbi:YdiU family protein [Antarcticibacterium flavum]|uniref:Protein nucleotidyltransferase YdiU n=1 Tax=Antarcticibacterium flavum TaxID=2058175 RepID=A0A5B7X306_9FLAO|nr:MULTISPECIES: YdiU family protein [Antarcticibacterium]MCM4160966.1 YdiU family protein [Antarcticibacterium sp. W02-3]QCY69008.1 YdiU family protein [Antarcticibacterium flavum]